MEFSNTRPKNKTHKTGKSNVLGYESGKEPSIREVAEYAGVSIATVSRVLKNPDTRKASRETVKRIQNAVERLQYRPSPAGIALRSGESRLVAFLIPDASNAYISAVTESLESTLRKDNLVMILCNTHEDRDLQDEYLLEMRSHLVKGIAMLGAVESPVLREFVESGEPVVFVNRKSPVGIDAPFVGIDNFEAGREVAECCIRNELRPCGMLYGPMTSSASAERYYGFLGRMAQSGNPIDPSYIIGPSLELPDAYKDASRLLDANPKIKAIFCTNDMKAYAAYRVCRERGLSVPEDIALFGFDDNPLNDWVAPWLNTISVPYPEFGPAVREIFQQIWTGEVTDSPPKKLLPYKLVLRTKLN